MKNKLVKLESIFKLIPGLSSANVDRVSNKITEYHLPYIRPSHRQSSSIDAYVDKRLVPDSKIFPAHTLYVSTDGQGSHTYSYVSVCEFVPNSNVVVLSPKREMNLQEKLYYAECITNNRYKFSYGRKPKGKRLENLLLPETVPSIIKNYSIKDIGIDLIKNINLPKDTLEYRKLERNIPIRDLFKPINGISSSGLIKNKYKLNNNWVPFIRPSFKQETSFTEYVNKTTVEVEKVFPKHTLYVSTNGQGSHTYSYVSTCEFVPNSDITVLIPKREMGLQEKVFYAQCITKNRNRFSYGRKPKGQRLMTLMIPEYPPNFVINYDVDNLISSMEPILETLE